MSIYSAKGSLFTGRRTNKKNFQICHDSDIDSPQLSGNQDGSPGMPRANSSATPRINIYAYAVQGAAYYLPDGGNIEFFLHDKPIEFYGIEACLVRNRHVPGAYVIRVPAPTAIYRVAEYKDMFEARQSIEDRNAEYMANSPYLHEREVGINCGVSELASEVPSSDFCQGTPLYAHSNGGDGRGGRNGYYHGPELTTQNFAVYPELFDRVQSYLDTTASVAGSSRAGSDDCHADGSTGGSSLCPGSANELLAQRNASVYENGHKKNNGFRYRTGHNEGYDLRANSGGYGRMFQAADAVQNSHRYAHQSYNASSGSVFGGHGQHGSFIPVIPVRQTNDIPVSLPPRHLNKKTNALYKTEMCRNWNEIGECRYGRSCQFAHGKKELRTVPRHGQWKTKTCMAWLHGGCTYGSRCCYAHEIIDDHGGPQSLSSTDPSASTNLGDAGESKFSEFFASRCWA